MQSNSMNHHTFCHKASASTIQWYTHAAHLPSTRHPQQMAKKCKFCLTNGVLNTAVAEEGCTAFPQGLQHATNNKPCYGWMLTCIPIPVLENPRSMHVNGLDFFRSIEIYIFNLGDPYISMCATKHCVQVYRYPENVLSPFPNSF